MSSLTRLVAPLNSPQQRHLFVAVSRTQLPPNTSFNLTHRISFSPRKFSKLTTTSSATKTRNPLKPDPAQPPPMDMDPIPIEPSDPAPAASGEDFVHIDSPEPLSESIVNVAEELGADDDGGNSNEGSGAFAAEPERKELPEELSRSVMLLTCESSAEGGSCDVYLVGTAHVSQESCKEVEAVVSYLKPQVVFLELCSSRIAVLTPQNIKVADKLEVFPGSEFRVAFEEARKYEGKVILGDRPVQITLRRTWSKMPLWHKIKLLYSLLFQAVFLPSSEDLNKMLKEMDDVDMLTLVIQEMSKEFPTLMETLVHERDQYMSSTLLRVASEHTSVVAVVGKGHMQGIKKHWKQPVVMKDLLELPTQKPGVSAVKILASLGMAVAGVAIISGIFLSRKK
ncbi:hypothetical protein Tsubulata_045905 [Turnera subulata]|uniref:TraB domain-containing protein-like n=1 Tax=Turnera subulata TaxID=218843 RepID=A0A9Q0J2V9_9ROSI|nr:hypothetical protein Tsubulata_045905 [Turnera subulata]